MPSVATGTAVVAAAREMTMTWLVGNIVVLPLRRAQVGYSLGCNLVTPSACRPGAASAFFRGAARLGSVGFVAIGYLS